MMPPSPNHSTSLLVMVAAGCLAIGGSMGYLYGLASLDASRAAEPAGGANAAHTAPDASAGSDRYPVAPTAGPALASADRPADVQALMASYTREADVDRRGALLAQLQANADERVLRFALQLANSGDPARREEGLALLQSFPTSDAQVRAFFVSRLENETDPARLKSYVEMLVPSAMPAEDAAPVLDELARLRRSADPQLRAASLLQTMQWDRQTNPEDMLHSALLDGEAAVREAAIAGVSTTRTRSPRIKDALLAIAADPGSSADERNAAVFALQDFSLNRGEYAIYAEAAERVEGGHAHE